MVKRGGYAKMQQDPVKSLSHIQQAGRLLDELRQECLP